jgi:hypothetical protein
MQEINKIHFGFSSVNTVAEDGAIVEKEEVTNSPNRPMAVDASYRIRASTSVEAKVTIFSDGSKEVALVDGGVG